MPLCHSYYPNYFTIEDILASQERVPCKVEVVLPKLGYLDVSSQSPDLQPGSKLELPHWMAHSLNAKRRPIISIELPKIYKEAYREIVSADPCAVDLNKWSSHFYEFGMHLTRYNHRECEIIQELLVQTFKVRFRLVMDLAQNAGKDPTVGTQLPILERNLFVAGRAARCQLGSWLKEGGGFIETSQMVASHKKRKRIDLDDDDT